MSIRINPIINTNVLSRATTRNMYDHKLQEAKQNLTQRMYVQQIEHDYFVRNLQAK